MSFIFLPWNLGPLGVAWLLAFPNAPYLIPRVKGGPSEPDNGQVLCRECNIKKSDKVE